LNISKGHNLHQNKQYNMNYNGYTSILLIRTKIKINTT